MKEIKVVQGKTLKLFSCLEREITFKENPNQTVKFMKDYIKSLKLDSKGPIITHSRSVNSYNNQTNCSSFLIQLNITNKNFKPSSPYNFIPLIEVPNCLFTEFIGYDKDIIYAYQKLHVYAYENDIMLCDDNYAVYIKDEHNGEIIVHIFIPTMQ